MKAVDVKTPFVIVKNNDDVNTSFVINVNIVNVKTPFVIIKNNDF